MPAGSRPTTESTSVRAAVDATSISGQFQVVGHRTQLILHVWECMCSLAIISLCAFCIFLPSLEWVPLQARNRFLFPPTSKAKNMNQQKDTFLYVICTVDYYTYEYIYIYIYIHIKSQKVRQVFLWQGLLHSKCKRGGYHDSWNRYNDNIAVTTTISVFITTRWFSMCSSVQNEIWIFIAFSKSQCPPLLSSLHNFFMSEVTMLGMQGQRIAGQHPPLVGRWSTISNAPRRLNAEGWACLQLLPWLVGLKILMAKEPKHAQKKWNNSLRNFAVPLIWQQIKCLFRYFLLNPKFSNALENIWCFTTTCNNAPDFHGTWDRWKMWSEAGVGEHAA